MKGLENLLKRTGRYLASTISAIALYSSAQEPAKIEVAKDGSWKKTSDITLYFQSTTGSQGRDPSKNPYNQSKAMACFVGRNNPDGSLTITYLTTDPENPSKDAAYASFNSSYVSFLSSQNLEARVSQRTILMDAGGNISFEKAQLKEEVTNPLIWVGQKIYEKADEYDPVKKIGDESGFFSGGTLDIIRNYADSFEKTSNEGLEKVKGKEISINQIPKRSRTSWITTTKKEIGTETTLVFLGDKEGKTKISVYYDIGLMKGRDTGRTKAYTGLIEVKTSAKEQTQTCLEKGTGTSNPLEGFWREKENKNSLVYITPKGIFISLPEMLFENKYTLMAIANNSKKEKEIYVSRIKDSKFNIDIRETGKVEQISNQQIKAACIIANAPDMEITLERAPELNRGLEEITQSETQSGNDQAKPIEKPKSTPPKQTTGPSYDIRNWMKK